MTTEQNPNGHERNARAAIEQLERLPIEQPYAEHLRAAEAAVAALRAAALGVVFPATLAPLDVATITDLVFCLDEMDGSSLLAFHSALIELHGLALDGHPELAAAIRGPRGRWRLRAACLAAATRGQHTDEAAFERAIAQQLSDRRMCEPWGSVLAVVIPSLTAQIDATRAAREAHTAAELAALEAKDAEAAQVIDVLREERRASLATRARNVPRLLDTDGEITTGSSLALKIREAPYERLDLYEGLILDGEVALKRRRDGVTA